MNIIGFSIICSFILMLCLLVLIIVVKIKSNSKINTKINETNKKFDKMALLGYKNKKLNYVGFNNKTKEITISADGVSDSFIKYDDIVKVELIENGKTTMSIGNVIGGAILAGGVGAIIGALNKNEKIISKEIKFSLNNFYNSSYEINMLDNNNIFEYGIDLASETKKIMDTVKYIIENKKYM